jgi:murein DD-endopeptidase MepM/ murein hydrolase activator NlpD
MKLLLNLSSIKKASVGIRNSLLQSKKSTIDSRKIFLRKTKVKSDSIRGKDKFLRNKKEYGRRKAQEAIIEAREIVTNPIKVVARATGGFLSRILSFMGTLLLGWIINNLPTIIAMAQEFIARAKRLYELFTGFISNVLSTVRNFGNVLGAIFQNIITLDFFDTSNRVKTALDDLQSNFDSMGKQLDEGMRLVTTSLSEPIAPGGPDYIPSTGTDYGPEPVQTGEPSQPYTGPETTDGGRRVSPQAVYSHLRSKGISHNHAMGILANIKGESDFEIGVSEKGDSRSGVGLFQYSNVRKPAFLRAVPDYKTNWKAQIDYAINEDRAPEYLKRQFSSAEEAAYWWMDKWERPAARVYNDRNKKHNNFIRTFKAGEQGSQSKQSATPSSSPLLGKIPSISVGERAGYSPSRGRVHAGRDIAAPSGTGLTVPSDSVIVAKGVESGYGNYVIFKDSKGIEHMYGHMIEQSPFNKGDTIKRGQIIGRVGSTGRSTGPHLHWEISPRPGEVGFSRKTIIDPIEYGYSSQIPFTSIVTAEQLRSQKTNQKSSTSTSTTTTTPTKTTSTSTTTSTPTQPIVRGKSGFVGSTNVVATGYKDSSGRDIKLDPGAAQSFKKMIADGMPFNSASVANVYRDENEYLRLKSQGYSPAPNSRHNFGRAADIHGAMNTWIRKNGAKYGWYANDYSGSHGGHFEWRGGGQSVSPQTLAQPELTTTSIPSTQQGRSLFPVISATGRSQELSNRIQTPIDDSQQIIYIDDIKQQSLSLPSGRSSSGMIPIIINNRSKIIKDMLLLDLSYT